jgi:hypothetical protein
MREVTVQWWGGWGCTTVNSGFILQDELMEFAEVLDKGCEKKSVVYQVSDWRNWKDSVPFTELRNAQDKQVWERNGVLGSAMLGCSTCW